MIKRNTKCIMNRTIFRGDEQKVEENIAQTIFDNFIEAFNWLDRYLANRNESFEIEEYHRVGFQDECRTFSNYDDNNEYWYTEVYDIELVS